MNEAVASSKRIERLAINNIRALIRYLLHDCGVSPATMRRVLREIVAKEVPGGER